MRFALPTIAALAVLAIACTRSSTEQATPTSAPTVNALIVASATPDLELSSEWSPDSVVAEIASQLFAEESRPVHIFGLNVEKGEEFVPSGRDVLPLPPNTSNWNAEFEGNGVWIVDTGELIYRFSELDMSFTVIYDYSGDR